MQHLNLVLQRDRPCSLRDGAQRPSTDWQTIGERDPVRAPCTLLPCTTDPALRFWLLYNEALFETELRVRGCCSAARQPRVLCFRVCHSRVPAIWGHVARVRLVSFVLAGKGDGQSRAKGARWTRWWQRTLCEGMGNESIPHFFRMRTISHQCTCCCHPAATACSRPSVLTHNVPAPHAMWSANGVCSFIVWPARLPCFKSHCTRSVAPPALGTHGNAMG